MPRVEASKFDSLRTWNGEQSRAFEEISYQLLKDQVPAGTRAIRTGNPDGGVEWYVTLADGTEWGWQAKHVHGIDALLTAMTDSVQRVAKERPTLRKLTFAISWNLGTGKAKWPRAQVAAEEVRRQGCGLEEGHLRRGPDRVRSIQESDLLDELAKPEHSGRRWFWWGDLVLGQDWLVGHYEQQASAASEKYRPDLQVDIPIQEELSALGFDQTILGTFNRLLREVVEPPADAGHLDEGRGQSSRSGVPGCPGHRGGAEQSRRRALALQAGDGPAALDPLLAQLDRLPRRHLRSRGTRARAPGSLAEAACR